MNGKGNLIIKFSMNLLWTLVMIAIMGCLLSIPSGQASESVVYSVNKELDLGNPGEIPRKDYFVNMGSSQGVRLGSILTVMKRLPTYDLLSEKLYKEIVFPIARLKVIHVENNVAVARIEKMLPSATTPIANPQAVMIGDIVRIGE